MSAMPEYEPDASDRRLVLTRACDIQPAPVVWAWEDGNDGRIPAGSFGLFAGREGTGKSSCLLWLAAKITNGTLPGTWSGEPRNVIIVAVEDSWKYTIVPRLMAAGADRERVFRAEVQHYLEGTVSMSLPADLALLEKAITEEDVAMVVLDPVMSAISDSLDSHVNREVRRALDPLARMADRTGCVMGGIAHFSKSSTGDASSLISGSGAFKDVARFIFAFAEDDDGTQVVTQTKNSLGRSGLPSMQYRMIEAAVDTGRGVAKVGKFVAEGVAHRSVHEIIADQRHAEPGAKGDAETFLRAALVDGPVLSRDIQKDAAQGHAIAKRTLDRAKKDLGVVSRKEGVEWYWSLPDHVLPAETPKGAKSATNGNLGKDANIANFAFPGGVGEVGNLPLDDDPESTWLAHYGPSAPFND